MLGRTPSQTVGPFFAIGLCRDPQNEVVPGGAVRLVGHVLDGAGAPVPDAVVELWQPVAWLSLYTFLIIGLAVARFKKTTA